MGRGRPRPNHSIHDITYVSSHLFLTLTNTQSNQYKSQFTSSLCLVFARLHARSAAKLSEPSGSVSASERTDQSPMTRKPYLLLCTSFAPCRRCCWCALTSRNTTSRIQRICIPAFEACQGSTGLDCTYKACEHF
ncbi:unnamed protein product [Ectocarpus sp. 13 AM-2016]